jgi:hypothetical protein
MMPDALTTRFLLHWLWRESHVFGARPRKAAPPEIPHKCAEKLINPEIAIRILQLNCFVPINAQTYPQLLCKNHGRPVP